MEVDDEWELLSDEDGFLQISDANANQIYSRNSIFRTNYFLCPCPPQFVETTADRDRDHDQPQPVQINMVDPDPISQIFFKRMKEAEFADESPKFEGNNYQFIEKTENDDDYLEEEEEDEDEDGGNVRKWKLSGIGGAICSLGVAAATFCIIVFTNHPHRNNHNLHFRIYTQDDRHKRMNVKRGPMAIPIAAVSGLPLSINIKRARITVGGYYPHHAPDADAPLSI